MTRRELPGCDALVLGSTTAALVCALAQADRGRQVLLVTPSTCLYEELFRAGDLRVPDAGTARSLLFPDDCLEENGLIHPDRLKQHGERLLLGKGIRLLYACQAVRWDDASAEIVHKSGAYRVACREVYDARYAPGGDHFLLHTMLDGQHHITPVPTQHTGSTADDHYRRYADALACLSDGHTLARSGTEAVRLHGQPMTPAPPAPACQPDEIADDCDVLVVGGGTSGAAAALFCARQGLRTVLIEMNHQLGGSATAGGVSTYWFGLRDGATRIIDEAVADLRRRYRQPARPGLWNDHDGFAPDLKAHALLGLCLDAGVDVRLGCIAYDAETADHRVTGVRYAWQHQPRLTRAAMTIDCTGDGDVCVLAGAAHTYGSEADGMTYWGSLAHYPQPDRYRNNFSTMVRVDDAEDYTRFIITGRTLGRQMYDHGSYVAVRESRHIRGLATVTLHDLLLMKPVQDPLYVCYSNYDPKGRLTAELCYFGLLPPNQRFVIPRGAVIPADDRGLPIHGLLIGGKAISCTHDAFPGIRMQADLQRQGLALAALAGCCVRQRATATQARDVDRQILALGGDLTLPAPAGPVDLKAAVRQLTGQEPWEWLDTPVTACETRVSPIVALLLAEDAEALPLLRGAYQAADTPQLRLTLARLLLWHRDETGAQTVLDAVRDALDAVPTGLPRRIASVNYGQMLPDHGLMPEPVYLINALAHAPCTDVAGVMRLVLDRLTHTPRDWYDLRAGIYCWCECFGWIAVRRHDAALAPLIRAVLALPELQGEPDDPLLGERLHMLRLGLLHALHALGCEDGADGLRRYLDDRRAAIRCAAAMLLQR